MHYPLAFYRIDKILEQQGQKIPASKNSSYSGDREDSDLRIKILMFETVG